MIIVNLTKSNKTPAKLTMDATSHARPTPIRSAYVSSRAAGSRGAPQTPLPSAKLVKVRMATLALVPPLPCDFCRAGVTAAGNEVQGGRRQRRSEHGLQVSGDQALARWVPVAAHGPRRFAQGRVGWVAFSP